MHPVGNGERPVQIRLADRVFPLRSIKQCGGFISRQVLVRVQPERPLFWKLKRTSVPPPVGSRTDLDIEVVEHAH